MFYETMHTANEAWLGLIDDIIRYGHKHSPRGKPIRELLAHQTQIMMRYPLVTMNGRQLGYRFAAAEAAWILSGDNRVATIKPYSRKIADFSDDGETFFGAYGPKIVAQMPYIIETLTKDPESRQAVINIWRESPGPSKDIPCSISVQFLIREDKLHCIYTMRSSDAWLGWVYDVFNFSMLSTYLLLKLLESPDNFGGLQLGYLSLSAGSQHLYYDNLEKAAQALLVENSGFDSVPPWEPHLNFSTAEEFVQDLWKYAEGEGAVQFLRDHD